MKRLIASITVICGIALLLASCSNAASASGGSVKLILGAYSAPSEVYAKLIPLFAAQWKAQTGQTVSFEQSYLGSGAQSRAIINGFPADIAALALAPDMDAIAKAGLITHDWTNTPTKGMVSDSIVAFAVRKGNPKGIHDWADLARPGIQVLTPNPRTSGGAQWNILALYGAALRGEVAGVAKDDPDAARTFLIAVLKNVKVMDKDARTSITTFEQGVGDVAITYESEVFTAQAAGASDELVIPKSTILIQTPVAVVDAYASRHGTSKVAQAFVSFLTSPRGQRVFAESGFRPVDTTVAQANAAKYAQVSDLWTVDFFGGWKAITTSIFSADGVYTRAIAAAQGG